MEEIDFRKTLEGAMGWDEKTRKAVAERLGISVVELGRKLNDERGFMISELNKLIPFLNLLVVPKRKINNLVVSILEERKVIDV